jgi:hypothetical protein
MRALRAGQAAPTEAHPSGVGSEPSRATGNQGKDPPLRSFARFPRALTPRRALAVTLLGGALAGAGAGAATAATAGAAVSQASTVATHSTATRNITAQLDAAGRVQARGAAAARPLTTWSAIIHAAAGKATGALPAADRLLPAQVSGPQSQMSLDSAQWANATTIVQQAMAKHMGLRSAVIAVATAMQESQLVNINYGTYDSLGLFQQQPDMGWGTAAQVTDPAYASDAFLTGLGQYQASNPGWATQPLWQAAQGVQKSAFPYAYAKWEVQAAHIVATVAKGMF